MSLKIHDEKKKHLTLLKEKNTAKRMIFETCRGDRERARKFLKRLRKVGKRKTRLISIVSKPIKL